MYSMKRKKRYRRWPVRSRDQNLSPCGVVCLYHRVRESGSGKGNVWRYWFSITWTSGCRKSLNGPRLQCGRLVHGCPASYGTNLQRYAADSSKPEVGVADTVSVRLTVCHIVLLFVSEPWSCRASWFCIWLDLLLISISDLLCYGTHGAQSIRQAF